MAASVTLLGSVTFDTNSGTKTVTATPAVDDLIIIVTAHTGNTSIEPPTDDNGSGTYTTISVAKKNASADTMAIHVRNQPIVAASSTVFTHAPGTTTGGGLAVIKIVGMNRYGINAILQHAKQENQSAATPQCIFGRLPLSTSAIIGAIFNETNPATMTARSTPAYTERSDSGYATPTTGLETMSINAAETSATITWGGASASAFSSIVIEVDSTTPDNKVFIPPVAHSMSIGIQPDSIHMSEVDLLLRRQTLALWYRNSGNRKSWFFVDPSVAPVSTPATMGTFETLVLGAEDFQIPWYVQTGATKLRVTACFAVDRVPASLGFRVVSSTLINAAATVTGDEVLIDNFIANGTPAGQWRQTKPRYGIVEVIHLPTMPTTAAAPANRDILLKFSVKWETKAANAYATITGTIYLIALKIEDVFPEPR